MSSKNLIRIGLNSLLGLVLVFVWSRFVDFEQIGKILQTVDPKFIISFIFFFGLAGALRGIRLKFLLNKYHLPAKDVIMLTYLAQFLSFMIPLRIGEISKGVYLHSQFDISLKKAVFWVFFDRFLDFLTIIFSIAILAQFIPTILPAKFLPILLAILVSCIVAFIVTNFIVKQGFLKLAGLLVYTGFILVVDGMIWWSAFAALGTNLGILESMLGNGLSALTFLIPSAPGYVGSAEAAGLAVFGGVLGFNANLASAATVLYHIITTVCLLVFGLLSLYLLKFDLGVVWRKLRKED